jgi:hypothetical protein
MNMDDLTDCMVTFEDVCKKLEKIEAKLAIRENYTGTIEDGTIPITVREYLIYLDINNELEKSGHDELVMDWNQTLSSYLNDLEYDSKNIPELYKKFVEYQVFNNMCHYNSETAGLSFPKINNEWYIKVLNMGEEAIPALLKYIDHFHWWAFSLLFDITKNCNIDVPKLPEDHRGYYDKVKEHWLNWGKDKGY